MIKPLPNGFFKDDALCDKIPIDLCLEASSPLFLCQRTNSTTDWILDSSYDLAT